MRTIAKLALAAVTAGGLAVAVAAPAEAAHFAIGIGVPGGYYGPGYYGGYGPTCYDSWGRAYYCGGYGGYDYYGGPYIGFGFGGGGWHHGWHGGYHGGYGHGGGWHHH